MGSLKAKRLSAVSDTGGGDHSYRNRCGSMKLPLEK